MMCESAEQMSYCAMTATSFTKQVFVCLPNRAARRWSSVTCVDAERIGRDDLARAVRSLPVQPQARSAAELIGTDLDPVHPRREAHAALPAASVDDDGERPITDGFEQKGP